MENEKLIEDLHMGCIMVTMQRMDEPGETIAGIAVDYLHEVLARAELSPQQRNIVDRMAQKIAVCGFRPDYGAYADCDK